MQKTILYESKEMRNESCELISFDIFDTLVTRRVGSPSGIFAIVQKKLENKKLSNDFLSNNYFLIRKEAEAFARFSSYLINGTYEINIDDIYKVMQDNYNLSKRDVEFLKNLEIESEIKNLVPIKKNIDYLKNKIFSGKRVVLISDMYFSSPILRKMLIRIDKIFADIEIYVSCDYKYSKENGGLFQIVRDKERVTFFDWCHCGDNRSADYKIPSLMGIDSRYLNQEKLLPYEEFLLKEQENSYAYQSVTGAAKLARINEKNIKKRDVYEFGVSFAGPILYNYVDWVIKQTLMNGAKCLYFIARDGYIPKIIADIIIRKRNLSLETKYLYGSRKAWRIPSEATFDEFVDSVLLEEYGDKIDIDFLAYRFGADASFLKKILNIESEHHVFKRKEREILQKKLKTDAFVRESFINLFEERKNLLKNYFRQEIDFDEKNIIFVDLHGSGKTQDHVSSILNEISDCSVMTFYLTNSLMKQKEKSFKKSYFSTINYSSHWIELLSRTPYGQTTGYRKAGEKIEPVTEEIDVSLLEEWGYEDYLKGIEDYSSQIVDFELINGVSTNTPDLYCKYFEYLKYFCDVKTAAVIGDIPYSSIGSEKLVGANSPKISFWKSVWLFLSCQKVSSLSEFPDISASRSGVLSRIFYKFTKKYPTIQKFVLNVYFYKKKKTFYIVILGVKISLSKFLSKG